MCKYCEPLISCPVGEKRRTILNKGSSHGNVIEMVMDRYLAVSEDDVYIHASFVDLDSSWHNMVFDIEYCPICGEKLKLNK